jgi:hypothetical protein
MEDKDFKNFINQEKIAAENLLNTTSKPATSLTETETGTEVTAASTTATPKTTAPTTAEA